MHRAGIGTVSPSDVLGKTIYGDQGEVLLARGVRLTPRLLKALTDRGYESVYIMDGIADDLEPVGLISDQLRASAVANVRAVFANRSEERRVGKECRSRGSPNH